MDKEGCEVYRFIRTLGKKWTYPLIYSFNPKKEYSFNEISRNCRHHVNKTLLSGTLKMLVEEGVLRKDDYRYSLTQKGERIQGTLLLLKGILLGGKEVDCSECVIKQFRFY